MNSHSHRDTRKRTTVAHMATSTAVGATLLSGLALAALPAHAQSIELPRADVVEQLGAQYAETQAAVGLTNAGGVIEVFTSGNGATWTLVLTQPGGTSQVIAAGETWIKR